MAAKKIIHYQTDAKKAAPEIEKLKAEKLEADRKLSEERKRLVETQRKLRDIELSRRRGELYPNKVYKRLAAYAFTCFKEHYRGAPTAMLQLFLRVLRGKLDHLDDADKHAVKMAVDEQMREWLAEVETNLHRTPAEFLKEEAA